MQGVGALLLKQTTKNVSPTPATKAADARDPPHPKPRVHPHPHDYRLTLLVRHKALVWACCRSRELWGVQGEAGPSRCKRGALPKHLPTAPCPSVPTTSPGALCARTATPKRKCLVAWKARRRGPEGAVRGNSGGDCHTRALVVHTHPTHPLLRGPQTCPRYHEEKVPCWRDGHQAGVEFPVGLHCSVHKRYRRGTGASSRIQTRMDSNDNKRNTHTHTHTHKKTPPHFFEIEASASWKAAPSGEAGGGGTRECHPARGTVAIVELELHWGRPRRVPRAS